MVCGCGAVVAYRCGAVVVVVVWCGCVVVCGGMFWVGGC